MTDDLPSQLWTERSVDDTLKLYADWAGTYEADVAAYGYATPGRIAQMLAAHLTDTSAPVLDFGCGTGLSGAALAQAGFETLDGTDISEEMLAQAHDKGVYRRVFTSKADELPPVTPGDYTAITATGVISLGAAPADTLSPLLDLLAPGGLLAFSYNDATLVTASYQNALASVQADGRSKLLAAAYGPHLPNKDGARGSTVYVLQRQ